MKLNWKRFAIVAFLVILSVGLDQWTKELARQYLLGQPEIEYWNGLLRLVYAENDGAFLSLGSGLSETLKSVILNFFPVLLLVGLFIYTLVSTELDQWQVIALGFIIGGGLSNVYDRIMAGKVTDFLHMRAFGLQTGVFNVADMAIMLGLFIMIPLAFRSSAKKKDDATAAE